MKNDFLFFVYSFALYAIGLFSVPIQDMATGKTFEHLIGNSKENISRLKSDCEKSGKECVMVYNFVALEADYE